VTCLGCSGRRPRARILVEILNDLHQRGVEDVLIACVDGLSGG
jgi:transposase-like protein